MSAEAQFLVKTASACRGIKGGSQEGFQSEGLRA